MEFIGFDIWTDEVKFAFSSAYIGNIRKIKMPRIEIVSHAAVDSKFLLTHLSHSLKAYNAFFGNKVLHGI